MQSSVNSIDTIVVTEPAVAHDPLDAYTFIYWVVFLCGAVFAAIIVHKEILPYFKSVDAGIHYGFWHWIFTFFIGANIYHFFRIYDDLHKMSEPNNTWQSKYKNWFGSKHEIAVRWASIIVLVVCVAGEFPIVELARGIANDSDILTYSNRIENTISAPQSPVAAVTDNPVEARKAILKEYKDQYLGERLRRGQFVFGCIVLFALMVYWDIKAWRITGVKEWEFMISDGTALIFWSSYYLPGLFVVLIQAFTVAYVLVMVYRVITDVERRIYIACLGAVLLIVNCILEPSLVGR